MPKTPQLSVTPSTTTSAPGSAKRRSIRIPRRSEEVVSSSGIANVMGNKDSEKNVVQTKDSSSPPKEGWKHPAELQYIRRADWSQDLMITYLCQKAFTVPPRQLNTTLSYTEITRTFSGEKIHIPRGYRIPLMFVAKFQWESLRLVLNSASEWEEYKFDIIHLSRLCTHFFKQAKSAASENKLTKGWRSPMFDRALIRFYRKWMVSREWSVKKFWEEYEEDEYKLDVLKFDWSRWVLKGHKGFVLTKEEVQNGVTADEYTDGLKRRPDGTWIWGGDDSGARATSLDALTCLASQDAVEAITDATPSHDSIEVKEELLGLDSDDVTLNLNRKRPRGDDGDSPTRSQPRRAPTRHCPQKSYNPRLFGMDRLTMHASRRTFPMVNKRKVVLTNNPGKSTPSTSTTMARIPTADTRNAIMKNLRPTNSPGSAQSKVGSSSLASGNSDVSKDGQESNSISQTTLIDPDNANPETMPNADASDPAMNDPIIDAPPQFGILPSSDQLSSTNTTINPLPAPSSSLPEANTTSRLTIIPNRSPSPFGLSDMSDSDTSDGLSSVIAFWETIQAMKVAPVEPQTITGSELMDAGEEGNNKVEDTIVIASHPDHLTSGPGEEIVVAGTQSAVEKVDTEENGIKSEVMNEDSSTMVPADTGSEGMNAVGGGKGTEGKKDTIDEAGVIGTMGDLVDGANGMHLRTETSTVEKLLQSRQKSPTPHNIDEAIAAGIELDEPEVIDSTGDSVDGANGTHEKMETFTMETQPLQSRQETPALHSIDEAIAPLLEDGGVGVHIESGQASPLNDTGVVIPLEVGAVESQSLDSQSFMVPTPIADFKATYNSVSTHGEFEVGNLREVETIHAGNLEDKMDVDKEMVHPIQPTPPLPTGGGSLTSAPYMMRMKSLQSIQLLQGLTHFLRMPSRDSQLGFSRMLEDNSADLKSQGMCPVIEHARHPSFAGSRLPTEEVLGVDQRLDVLAHALTHVSVTLAKNLYPYRGKELEMKIDILDKSLQQQFETIQKQDGRSCEEMYEPLKELGAHPDTAFDPSAESTLTEALFQGVQTSLPSHININRQFKTVEVQTETEKVPAPQPLSADATMVDLTIHSPPFLEPPSTPVAKAAYQPENNRSVAKTVMSIMRNMADLLECTTQGGSVKSLKGKEKEDTDVDMIPSYLDSPAFTTILEEFKSMKEEMRRTQHKSQSEVESIRLSHFMEVEALKDEIRAIENKGKQELEEVTRQYGQQIWELKSTIRLKAEREGERERQKEGGSEKLPSLELLELRRRVASLEERSRSDSISVDVLRSGSRASMTDGHLQDPVISRHPSHFLSTDFEEQPYTTTFRAPGQLTRERSISKPGTPAPIDGNPSSNRHPEVTDLNESMPLPAKSQRKMHKANFFLEYPRIP